MSKDKQVQQDNQSKTRVNKPVQEEMKRMETAVSSPIPSLQRAYADPRSLSPADAKILQRTIGNQALGRLTIQRKMTVGPVGDKYEQEADAVAKQVVSKLHTSPAQNAPAQTAQRQEEEELQMKPLVQRQEEEELQMKPLPIISSLQRQEEEELQMKPLVQRQEEEELQMKPLVQRQEEEELLQAKGDPMLAGGELSGDVESSVQSAKSGGQPMSDNIRAPMEQAFNADFSGVKVHTDNQSDTLNRSISARAFTTGQDIFFRSGEYNPSSSGGQELLAHELTHTIQQESTPIKRQMQPATIPISAMHLPQVQRAWDVVAIEKSNPKPFAALLAKMHDIPMFRHKTLTDLAAVTDSPRQLDDLVARIPAIQLKDHLAAFPHPEIIKKIVYLCTGSGQFNGIMNTISTLGMADEIIELFDQETAVTLTEIDSVIDEKQESEGLKASNGTLIGLRTVSGFPNEPKKAIQDALDAYDNGSEHPWSGKWGAYHGNNNGDLPGIKGRGGYSEYDVRKSPTDKSRWGSRRLVIHNTTGRIYYTWTHYGENGKPAFVRIR